MERKQVLARVKIHLLKGKKITQEQCRIWYNGWRLADVVWKLRERHGLNVQKKTIYDKRTGVSFAQYYLPKRATS